MSQCQRDILEPIYSPTVPYNFDYLAQPEGNVEAAAGYIIGELLFAPGLAGGNPPIGLVDNNTLQPQRYYVPQRLYTAPKAYTALPPVTFHTGGHEGVFLAEVESGNHGLDNAKDQIFLGRRIKISHRLRVTRTGLVHYSSDKQVPSCRATPSHEPLTRHKIACHVARTIRECMKRSDDVWKIAQGITLRFEDLVLLKLINVSEGSWQPILAFYI